jgi:photosystem II stability/assembly factor-like uncharacterized protein
MHMGDQYYFSEQTAYIHWFGCCSELENELEWDSIVCHKGTIRRAVGIAVLGIVLSGLAAAQGINWRRVGNTSVNLLLASPATGPVEKVWFSESGSTLYARTRGGRVFETSDYEVWQPSQNTLEPALQPAPSVARMPENGVRLVSSGFGRVYAMGLQLFRSDDGGRSWANLTAFRTESVIGLGQRSVAVSPSNQDQIVVANDFGVWRSMDGGLSWSGLNELLPNLPVKRILATPHGTSGTRAYIDGIGTMEVPPGGSVWQAVDDQSAATDAMRL